MAEYKTVRQLIFEFEAKSTYAKVDTSQRKMKVVNNVRKCDVKNISGANRKNCADSMINSVSKNDRSIYNVNKTKSETNIEHPHHIPKKQEILENTQSEIESTNLYNTKLSEGTKGLLKNCNKSESITFLIHETEDNSNSFNPENESNANNRVEKTRVIKVNSKVGEVTKLCKLFESFTISQNSNLKITRLDPARCTEQKKMNTKKDRTSTGDHNISHACLTAERENLKNNNQIKKVDARKSIDYVTSNNKNSLASEDLVRRKFQNEKINIPPKLRSKSLKIPKPIRAINALSISDSTAPYSKSISENYNREHEEHFPAHLIQEQREETIVSEDNLSLPITQEQKLPKITLSNGCDTLGVLETEDVKGAFDETNESENTNNHKFLEEKQSKEDISTLNALNLGKLINKIEDEINKGTLYIKRHAANRYSVEVIEENNKLNSENDQVKSSNSKETLVGENFVNTDSNKNENICNLEKPPKFNEKMKTSLGNVLNVSTNKMVNDENASSKSSSNELKADAETIQDEEVIGVIENEKVNSSLTLEIKGSSLHPAEINSPTEEHQNQGISSESVTKSNILVDRDKMMDSKNAKVNQADEDDELTNCVELRINGGRSRSSIYRNQFYSTNVLLDRTVLSFLSSYSDDVFENGKEFGKKSPSKLENIKDQHSKNSRDSIQSFTFPVSEDGSQISDLSELQKEWERRLSSVASSSESIIELVETYNGIKCKRSYVMKPKNIYKLRKGQSLGDLSRIDESECIKMLRNFEKKRSTVKEQDNNSCGSACISKESLNGDALSTSSSMLCESVDTELEVRENTVSRGLYRSDTFYDKNNNPVIERVQKVGASPNEPKELPAQGITGDVQTGPYRKSRLMHIIDELVQSEGAYVHNLGKIIKDYMFYLDERQEPSLIGRSYYIFGNIPLIHEKSTLFYNELQTCMYDYEEIGKTFLSYKTKLFDLYPVYFRNKLNADKNLRKDFKNIIEARHLELGDPLNLACYLHTPIQRLGQYIMLLDKMKNELAKCNASYSFVEDALRMVQTVMSLGNDCVAIESIENLPVELKNFESFIKRDVFILKPKMPVTLFLFNDILLITTINPKNNERYVLTDYIYVTEMGIVIYEHKPLIFCIKRFKGQKVDCEITIKAPSQDVKRTWTKLIEDRLWKQLFQYREKHLRLSMYEND